MSPPACASRLPWPGLTPHLQYFRLREEANGSSHPSVSEKGSACSVQNTQAPSLSPQRLLKKKKKKAAQNFSLESLLFKETSRFALNFLLSLD